MIEVRLSTESSNNTLIRFDGQVVEFFSYVVRQSIRIHVFQIARIEIVTDKKGRNLLNVTSKYVDMPLLTGETVRPEALADAQAFVMAVQQAMASYS